MKIVKETSAELTFRAMPRFDRVIATLICSTGFLGLIILFSLVMWTGMGNVVTSCERLVTNAVNCQSKRSPLLDIGLVNTTKYDNVVAAKSKIKESRDSEGGITTSYQMILVTDSGSSMELMSVNGVRGFDRTKSIATKINNFLRSQEKSITINEELELATIFALLVAQFVGIAFSILVIITLYTEVRIVSLNINKNSNKITSSSLSIFGFWKYSFALDDIKEIAVKKNEWRNGESLYSIHLILKRPGKKIELGSYESRDIAVAKVNKIQKFIHLSVVEVI